MVGIEVSKEHPCCVAHSRVFARPNIVAISSNASVSSIELKKGNRLVRIERSMTPADQVSISVG